MRVLVSGLFVSLIVSSPARGDIGAELDGCRAIPVFLERLYCYDRINWRRCGAIKTPLKRLRCFDKIDKTKIVTRPSRAKKTASRPRSQHRPSLPKPNQRAIIVAWTGGKIMGAGAVCGAPRSLLKRFQARMWQRMFSIEPRKRYQSRLVGLWLKGIESGSRAQASGSSNASCRSILATMRRFSG